MFCLDDEGRFDTTNFEKAMKIYQDVRIERSAEILNFSKSLGSMQASRSHESRDGKVEAVEMLLKVEVLMYGTLPVMMPGADHDYKNDVRLATEEPHETISDEEAKAALESLFGLDQPPPPRCGVTPQEAYDAWMTLMTGA